MKRILLCLFVLNALTTFAFAERNTALVHPGEVVYVRFEVLKGSKIKFAHAGKEKDDAAQVIFTFDKEIKGGMRALKVENKFPHDLVYKAEMRSLSQNHERRVEATPVVAGKVAFDPYPPIVEELAFFDFKLLP
jgi:hypothetical protein